MTSSAWTPWSLSVSLGTGWLPPVCPPRTSSPPVLSTSSRSRFVEAEIKNKSGKWLSGSFVALTVPLAAEAKPVISIPAEAITLDDKGAYLFVLKEGKATKTYVTTALRTPISVTITDGLSEGDTVAVSGLMNLRDGSSVKIKSIRNRDSYEVAQ